MSIHSSLAPERRLCRLGLNASIGAAMFLALILCLGVQTAMGREVKATVQEIGVPVRGVNWVRLIVGKDADGEEALYASMGQQAENLFILQINPRNGNFIQHKAPVAGSNYPTACAWGKDDRLYVGAAYSGHLLCYDPKLGAIEDLGAIDPPEATFPCGIAVDALGRLWIGCYGNASLTRYDPGSGEFTRLGRCDEVDMYCYPWVGSDGTLACRIGVTNPHVVAANSATGEKRGVGPVVAAGEPGRWLNLQRRRDGLLYIISSEGEFRLCGMEAEPVDEPPAPEAAPTLADGCSFAFADAAEQVYRALLIHNPTSGERREFYLDYEAAGTSIFLLHLGPDGKVYGSSIMPEHLFCYDPDAGQLADLGRCSEATGEAYSMGNMEGKLYICSYPGARLSAYDPKQPYHYGSAEDDNPRELGRMDEVSYRPRAMLAGPLGRVWIGSYPDYGMWGGPLSCYDPRTGEKRSYRNILANQSVISLAWLEDLGLIAAGTSIRGGSGTQPKAKEAALFVWDPVQEKMVWHGSPRPGTESIIALATGANGILYGVAMGKDGGGAFSELFAFVGGARSFVHHLALCEGQPLDNSLQRGPDGAIWDLTEDVLYRLDPEKGEAQVVARMPGEFDVTGPIVGNTLYFATNHRLRALRIETGK